MNQRNKRSSERKKQNTDGATMATGGHVVRHIPNESPEVRVPSKVTGDVKPQGVAKASPFFKKIEEVLPPKTKADEKKIIAAATETTIKDEDKK